MIVWLCPLELPAGIVLDSFLIEFIDTIRFVDKTYMDKKGKVIEHIPHGKMQLLGNVGFDPVYGARPLKRAIQQQLENPLATKILSSEFVAGDTVRVEAEGGALVFRKS